MTSMFENLPLTALVLYGLAFLSAALVVCAERLKAGRSLGPLAVVFVGVVPATVAAALLLEAPQAALSAAVAAVAVLGLLQRPLADFSAAGRLLLVSNGLFSLAGFAWALQFTLTLSVGPLTRGLMLLGLPLLILALPIGLLAALEQWEVLCRVRWRRPGGPAPAGAHFPRVCLQVPTYAEPPEIVIATLDALSRLRYPNFEVMVIDNNTKDEKLWRPVEAHCRKLGEHFRFFHVDPLSGAKAGALNFALRHTAAEVEIIGVVDADYQAEPDFLEALIGHFDDPRMGFVQTPHDYRDWQQSLYQTLCYWEYRGFFATTMVSLNERDAGLTVGTMCLIRRRALEAAGGWSEWCQTEDSELAIRIHAAGYSSVFVPETFGRGLIPETFAGYKKQRFRWTYGPVQEFKHHLPLYLPARWATPSALTFWQKLHHLNHGLVPFLAGLSFLLMPVNLAVIASLLWHDEQVSVPAAWWVGFAATQVGGWALTWLTYRKLMGCSLGEMFGALFARQSLAHTALVASVWGLFTDRIPWRRTNKFKALPSGLAFLAAVRTELFLALGFLSSAAALLLFASPTGLALALVFALLMQGLGYLPPVAMAWLAERELQNEQKQPVFRPAFATGLATVAAGIAAVTVLLPRPVVVSEPAAVPQAPPPARIERPAAQPRSPLAAALPPVRRQMLTAVQTTAAQSRPVPAEVSRPKPAATAPLPSDPPKPTQVAIVPAPALDELPLPLVAAPAPITSGLVADTPEETAIELLILTDRHPNCLDRLQPTADYHCRDPKN